MKKFMWVLILLSIFGLSGCGSESSKEAKELQKKIINLVGIPPEIVANICQDDNLNKVCDNNELQAKVSFKLNDSLQTIWAKLTQTAEGRYLLETYDPSKPLLLELEDKESQYFTEQFTIPFNGFKVEEEEKELSILQSMVDSEYLQESQVKAIRETNSKDFYNVLLKDFEVNLKTLNENDISTPRAVEANIKEVADELLANGVADTLPQTLNECNGTQICIDDILNPLSQELQIDENESNEIKANETKKTKELFANKTFYAYLVKDSQPVIIEVKVNKSADSWSYKTIKGGDKSGIEIIEIDGDKLTIYHPEEDKPDINRVSANEKYISFVNNDSLEQMKFFYTKLDAEEAFIKGITPSTGESNKFTFPATFYNSISIDNEGNGVQYEADRLSFTSDKKFIYNELILKDGKFIIDSTANSDYSIVNGEWKKDNDSAIQPQYSDDYTVAILERDVKLTINSIRNIEGKNIKIDGSDKEVLMLKGAEEITFGYEVLKNKYYINEKQSARTFEELIKNNCDNSWFSHVDENSDIRGIAFSCGQENQTSGSLVGVTHDGSLVKNGIGSWEIITLPNSNIKALITTIEKKYHPDQYFPLFSIKNGELWRGDYEKAGTKDTFVAYNEVAFDAFTKEILDMANNVSKEIAFTKELLQNKVVYELAYIEDDGTKGYGKTTFKSDTFAIRNEIAVSSEGKVVEENSFDVNFVLEDGKIRFETKEDSIFWVLNRIDETSWTVTFQKDYGKNGTIEQSESKIFYFSKPSNFPENL